MRILEIQTYPKIGIYCIGKETKGKIVFIPLKDKHLKIIVKAILENNLLEMKI